VVNLFQNGNKTANINVKKILIANINVKNFHRSLTTVERAHNGTSKTANITDTIFSNAAVDISVIFC